MGGLVQALPFFLCAGFRVAGSWNRPVPEGLGMGIKQSLALIALCLGGLLAPAWGAAGAERSKICLDCHDDLPDMSRSAHATATDARTPDCIACHGASESHAYKKPGQKQGKPDRVFKGENALPAHEGSPVCQTCHD